MLDPKLNNENVDQKTLIYFFALIMSFLLISHYAKQYNSTILSILRF